MALRHPPWIRKRISVPLLEQGQDQVGRVLDLCGVRTVCSDAHCPNLSECFSKGCATFILMGPSCSRSCRFCAVDSGRPLPLDPTEPDRVARAAQEMNLDHVVITSVTRDDLPDGGAEHIANTLEAVKSLSPQATVEALIPDFQGHLPALWRVLEARPDVLNHNVETVPRLYPMVRPQASFERSLSLLAAVKERKDRVRTKSGIMVGIGETDEEVLDVLHRLRDVRCDMMTVGQYLAPSASHLPVQRYVSPEQFEAFKRHGERLGIPCVVAGPFVRSSWHAGEVFQSMRESRPLALEGEEAWRRRC